MKEKLQAFLKKLWSLISDSKYEKVIIIGAPIAALLIAAVIVAPAISALFSYGREPAQAAAPEAAPAQNVIVAPPPSALPPAASTAVPASSAAPSTEPSAGAQEIKTVMRASSSDRDLYITVYNEAGQPVTGEVFSLSVTFPNGQTYTYDSDTEGSCYLVKLEPGNYWVTMNAHEGYQPAEAINCQVLGELVYEQIEDIDEYVEVLDVAQVPEDEVKTPDENTAPTETVAEEITTPEDPYAGSGFVPQQQPVLDSRGYQTYTYTFHTDEANYLYYRDRDEVSDVQLVDEGQGVYYGLRQEGEVVNAVELFNEDNTPVAEYDITAVPLMSEQPVEMGWREINGSMYYYDATGNPVKGLKKIDGRVYYFDAYGVRASSVGIDVSYYNGDINWQAVKAQGIDFAIIRVGGRTWQSGVLYDDYRTVEYFTKAKNAGLKVGAYFYSTAITPQEAVEEASVALQTLNGVGLDYPVFFDTEYSGIRPEGRADNLSTAERSEIIRAFCETIRNSGYRAGVYTGEYFMKNNLDYNSISQYSIWLASYTLDNALPNFGGRYDMWQFTDSGLIDGINGYVDMNVVF